jgi:hypothetical protein
MGGRIKSSELLLPVREEKSRCHFMRVTCRPLVAGNGEGLTLDHETLFLMSHSAGGHVAVEYNKESSSQHMLD